MSEAMLTSPLITLDEHEGAAVNNVVERGPLVFQPLITALLFSFMSPPDYFMFCSEQSAASSRNVSAPPAGLL